MLEWFKRKEEKSPIERMGEQLLGEGLVVKHFWDREIYLDTSTDAKKERIDEIIAEFITPIARKAYQEMLEKKEKEKIMSKNYDYKQVIVLRKDLKMRKGKMIAQGCHACMKATLENIDHPDVKAWLDGRFAKIVVSVDSEDELFEIHRQAKSAGLVCSLIQDAGFTEFNGVPTYTAVAVGPAQSEKVDVITSELKLL